MRSISRSERTELLCRQSLIVAITLLALGLHWWGLLGNLQAKHDAFIAQVLQLAGQIDLAASQAPLQEERRIILQRHGIVTVVALFVMLLIQWLSWHNWHMVRRARRSEERLSSIIERFPGYVMVQEPDGPIAAINPAFSELLRQLGPNKPNDTNSLNGPDSPHSVQDLLRRLYGLLPEDIYAQIGKRGKEGNVSCEFSLSDGRHFELHRIALCTNSQELGQFWMARDITVTKHREMTLVQQAHTDVLTGLPNRRALTERIQHTLYAIRSGEQSAGALLILDIDYFKKVNDTWGHAVGDEVLCHLAVLLRDAFHRPSDLSGRWGGEEFAVLLPQTKLHHAKRLAENLRSAVSKQPALTSRGPVPITISIGIAALHVHLSTLEQAMSQADTALYSAKKQGRNAIAVGRPEWNAT